MVFGFLIGLQHALEADHIVAVATLTSDTTGLRRIARHGAIWGVGHALTLGAFGGTVYVFKLAMTPQLENGLELVVGAMLALLGSRVIYRIWRDRVHFHVHRHTDGDAHFHAHSHAGDVTNHKKSKHAHVHTAHGWRRSLGVGMMHGLAGSAALVALTASMAETPILGFAFMALFGLGSILGMVAFSAAIAVPFTLTARSMTWVHRGLQLAAGLIAFGFGLHIVIEKATALAAGV